MKSHQQNRINIWFFSCLPQALKTSWTVHLKISILTNIGMHISILTNRTFPASVLKMREMYYIIPPRGLMLGRDYEDAFE